MTIHDYAILGYWTLIALVVGILFALYHGHRI